MTSLASLPLATTAADSARERVWHTGLLLAACALLGAWLSGGRWTEVWQTGAFYDTDDAMRAVQVRDWLAGQPWFDLSVPRMQGMVSHWSRIVDVPLGALTLLGRLWLSPEMAERFARLAFPALLAVALYAAVGAAAATLAGRAARPAGIILAFLGAPVLGQFVPGRIDHHAPQILLLVLMIGASLAAFEPGRSQQAAAAGICAALSLGISLENLPFIVIIAAAWPLRFILRGEDARAAQSWFAVGFGGSLVLVFLATIGPARWFEPACDAYSIAHLAAGVAGSMALAALSALGRIENWLSLRRDIPPLQGEGGRRPGGVTVGTPSPTLPLSGGGGLATIGHRAAAALLVAPLPILALILVAPRCLGDPFIGLDPLVRDLWLHHVDEVEPLTSFVRTHPSSATVLGLPCLTAFAAAIVLALRTTSIRRERFVLLAALVAVAFAMTLWGIRVFSSGLPIVAIIGAAALVALWDHTQMSTVGRAAIVGLCAIPFAPLPLAFALPPDPDPEVQGSLSCLTPAALAPLARLPEGLMLAPIDAGAHLLAFTPHAVLGGPYHRNNVGNRLTLDALLAPAEMAKDIVERSGATYVAICPQQTSPHVIAERAPQGLAADLLSGRAPNWLERVPLESPQQVYRVR